jgi:hypothetical protein
LLVINVDLSAVSTIISKGLVRRSFKRRPRGGEEEREKNIRMLVPLNYLKSITGSIFLVGLEL